MYQITLGPLCFGLEVVKGAVKVAAPVAGWTVGKKWKYVLQYYRNRGAKLLHVCR